jgi:hypothetical protein
MTEVGLVDLPPTELFALIDTLVEASHRIAAADEQARRVGAQR